VTLAGADIAICVTIICLNTRLPVNFNIHIFILVFIQLGCLLENSAWEADSKESFLSN
jgi:hypothetical protein